MRWLFNSPVSLASLARPTRLVTRMTGLHATLTWRQKTRKQWTARVCWDKRYLLLWLLEDLRYSTLRFFESSRASASSWCLLQMVTDKSKISTHKNRTNLTTVDCSMKTPRLRQLSKMWKWPTQYIYTKQQNYYQHKFKKNTVHSICTWNLKQTVRKKLNRAKACVLLKLTYKTDLWKNDVWKIRCVSQTLASQKDDNPRCSVP